MTAGKEFEGRTVTDRLNRLSILYSEDIFSPTIRQNAKGIPNQIKQKKKFGCTVGKALQGKGIHILEK